MSITADYYAKNAGDFVASTFDVDVSVLRDRFLKHLPARGRILDAGCGSGRDALAFFRAGYDVSAFDAVPEMVEAARKKTGLKVDCDTFQELSALAVYEGIWACASLLHVPLVDMSDVFLRLARALVANGVLYCSFKFGDGEVERNGRVFSCFTDVGFRDFVSGTGFFEVEELWTSTDVRPEREAEMWLNVILRQGAGEVLSRY